MNTYPTLSLDADGLRITVTYAGRDAWNRGPHYTWTAHDIGADDPAAPIAESGFTTSATGHSDLRTALATAVTYAAAGSDYSPQPAELRHVNPATWQRMLDSIGVTIPARLAERVAHVSGTR